MPRGISNTVLEEGEIRKIRVELSPVSETDRSAGARKISMLPAPVQTSVQIVSENFRPVTGRFSQPVDVCHSVHTNSVALITVTVTELDDDTMSVGRIRRC